MTSNPHPEHGPLWVERDADPDDKRLPHKLRLSDDWLKWLSPADADAIEAQITPLPDGVYRARLGHKRGHELAAGYELPAGWTAPGLHGDGPWVSRVLVCRIPAEPPAPPTEDVPLHELCGWKLPGALWVVQSVRIAGRHIYAFDTLNPFEATISHPVTLNPDGTVTVQAQGVES